ncbi:MAG: hypothetical protein ACK535_14815 [Cyanobacteriota bacterium]
MTQAKAWIEALGCLNKYVIAMGDDLCKVQSNHLNARAVVWLLYLYSIGCKVALDYRQGHSGAMQRFAFHSNNVE